MNGRLPLGAVQSQSGILEASLSSSDTMTFDGHGLETDAPVTVRAASGGTLSAPLVDGVTYYAIRLTSSTFKLSATVAGSAINLTTDGSLMIVAREPDYDGTIEFYSRWADTFFPGHDVPFTGTIPALVKGLVADLAAKKILNINGKSSEIVNAFELAAMAQLQRFAAGMPVRDETATAPSNLAITSSHVADAVDPRGWGSGSLP